MVYPFSEYMEMMRDSGAFDTDGDEESDAPRFPEPYEPNEAERAAYEAECLAYVARLEAGVLLPEDEPF